MVALGSFFVVLLVAPPAARADPPPGSEGLPGSTPSPFGSYRLGEPHSDLLRERMVPGRPPEADPPELPVVTCSLEEMHELHARWFVDMPDLGFARMAYFKGRPRVYVKVNGASFVVARAALMALRLPRGPEPPDGWRRVELAAPSSPDVALDQRFATVVDVEFDRIPLATELEAILPLLRGGVVSATIVEGKLRVFGVLRAVEACASCHGVPEKTLLGALVYELEPVPEPLTAGVAASPGGGTASLSGGR